MAINPINLNPGQFNVPTVDFSWLANLPNTYAQGEQNKLKLDEANRQQGALAELSKLNPRDPNYMQQVAQIAFRMGQFPAGASLLNTAEEAAGRRSAPSFPAAPAAAPTVAPVATPGTPAPVSPAPTLVPPQAAPQTPQVAPGIPALPQGTPGVPSIAPPRTGALLQPQTTQTPPIMAQGGASSLLRKFEGYRDAPYWDVNAYRIGFGSDTITDPATGEVRRVRSGDRINRQMAEADLARRIPEFQRTIAKQYEGFGQLPENVQAALTSIGYNYGRLPSRVVSALGSGDREALAKSVESLASDNGGVNASRRQQEAAIIRGGLPGAPGTVLASLQGRGPTSGTTVASARPIQTAAIDPANFNISNPAIASDISPTPMARTAAVGNQAAGGPASVTNPGGTQPSLLPSPTPLQGALPQMPIPQMSLAALGQPGGVGTIGAPGQQTPVPSPIASDASPVQMAQAAPYSPPFQTSAPQAAPPVFQRPPIQAAPAVAPQGPPAAVPGTARGPVDNSPLAHVTREQLMAIAGHRYSTEGNRALAIAELNRRSALVGEQNKTSPEYNNYLRDIERGAFPRNGTFIEWQQAGRADTTHKRNYDAIVAERAAQGLPPPPGGYERYLDKMKPGTTVNVGGEKIDRAETAFVERMEKIADAGGLATRNKSLVGALEAMDVTTGFTAAALAKAGEFGLNLTGTDKVQAFNSLIDFMVPAQPRTPGPQAAMETAMLRNSLPKLINQEGGTKIIMSIMRASADIEERMGDIAERYMTSEKDENGKRIYTAAQANKDMKAVREESRDLVATAVRLAAGKSAPPAASGTSSGTESKWTYPEGTSAEDKAAADKILQDAMRKR